MRSASTSRMSASCSATHAPVIDAVRVPPSAWMTSQSIVTVNSPSRFMSVTARSDRPIRRSISIERPLRPFCSRGVRCAVEAGSIAYSAVTHPARLFLRHAGTPSSTVAVQSTRVSPNSARHEPWAFFMTLRVSLTGRIPSFARPYERAESGMVDPFAGFCSPSILLQPRLSRAQGSRARRGRQKETESARICPFLPTSAGQTETRRSQHSESPGLLGFPGLVVRFAPDRGTY